MGGEPVIDSIESGDGFGFGPERCLERHFGVNGCGWAAKGLPGGVGGVMGGGEDSGDLGLTGDRCGEAEFERSRFTSSLRRSSASSSRLLREDSSDTK